MRHRLVVFFGLLGTVYTRSELNLSEQCYFLLLFLIQVQYKPVRVYEKCHQESTQRTHPQGMLIMTSP